MLKKGTIIRLVILQLILVFPVRIPAQNIIIDTTDYLPLFFNGALEYNLMIASSKGYYEEAERMILQGAEVNAETADGVTPLIFAVINKRLQTVKTLIRYDADVNKITTNRESPLLLSAKNGGLEIAEVLIRYGADIDFADKFGATALHYASIYGDFYLVDLLLYYRAEADKKAFDGTTPLMAAIWAGHHEVADLLIQNGANMEARDNEGFTPLLIASQNGDTLLINLLLKKGVDIYEKNLNNFDALGLAIKSDQKDAAELLINSGDKWNDTSRETVYPYNVAIKYRRKEIIELLKKYNFPFNYKPETDQIMLSVSGRFTLRDFYSGINFRFREPLTNIGVIAGCDAKLWYTGIARKEGEDFYIQYFDKSYLVYAGVFKEYPLTDNLFRSNLYFSGSLSGAYFFGNKFKGTSASQESKFKIIPGLSLRWAKDNLSIFAGAEYINTDMYRIGPVWTRIGCSYNFLFDNVNSPPKDIKWY